MKPNVNDMTFEEFSNFFNPIRAVIKGAHANLHDKDYEGVTDIFLGGGKCSDFEGVVKRAFEIKEELKAISKTRKASVDNLKKISRRYTLYHSSKVGWARWQIW